MAGNLFPTFAETLPGERLNVVGTLRCWDSSHDAHLFTSASDGVTFLVVGLIDGSSPSYTFMHATMKMQYPFPVVVLDEDSRIFRHEPPSWDSIYAVIELCAGFGGMSQGLTACGFHPVLAVDFNEKMCQLYEQQCNVPTIVGDVNDLDTVCKVWHFAKGAGTVAAGFACQPFSRLGDQKGGQDARAQSLRGILQVAFYVQAHVLILECVTPASTNQFVKEELQKFVDVTGFSCSQVELQLSDIWPSRRSRSWWLLTSPFLGQIPLVPWPKSDAISKVNQIIPGILPWDESDENLLALVPEEVTAFGADSEAYFKYLLNFEGCAPCALHAWGSQVLACECGCRPCGLSQIRLQEKGLFGLLVFSAASTGERKLRHVHPCECNALNGFDPVIDFGHNPRLTLAASGQMASPLQTAWIFATLAARIHSLKQMQSNFSACAMLQALVSWTLMRCRQVWPCCNEPVHDPNLRSLMCFWEGYEKLSIHELLHPPRWPALAGQPIFIASVLDFIIREHQCNQSIPQQVYMPGDFDAIMNDVAADEPTPWLEVPQHAEYDLPDVSPFECAVIFRHERAAPIRFVMHSPCTVQEVIIAQTKLAGQFEVKHVCNFYGVEIPLNHVIDLGQLIFIQCEGLILPDDVFRSCVGPCVGNATILPMALPGESDQPVKDPPKMTVSPTIEWSQPVCAPKQETLPATVAYDRNDQAVNPTESVSFSMLAAAPLLALQADQFLRLQVPVIKNVDHLTALRHQVLRPEDRVVILRNQRGVWSDDEFRFHLDKLCKAYENFQMKFHAAPVKKCVLLDPLLITGWVHHGHAECGAWCSQFPDIKQAEHLIITCCALEGHWIPLVLTPVAGNLHVTTWDDPNRDHSMLKQPMEAIGKALGFHQVIFVRHHRLFFSSDQCGAMAVAFLNHSLLDTMLPTSQDEMGVIHERLRKEFEDAISVSFSSFRPWVWGTGDVERTRSSSGMQESDQASSSNQPLHTDAMASSFSHQCITKEARMDLLREKGRLWGDDEIRFHLLNLLKRHETNPSPNTPSERGYVMMDPLLLSTWDMIGKGMCETWCRANKGALKSGLHVVAIFLVEEHWFPVWFNYHGRTIVAHRIADELVTTDTIMPVLSVLRDELGFEAAVEHVMPNALEPHRLCGASAIGFVSHLLAGTPLPQNYRELEELHVSLKAEFVEALHQGTCCICPVAWGAGQFSQVVQTLATELLKHGVPEDKVEQRANQAVKAIGSDNVSTALKSKNAWRSLKALGSNVRFQFLLPDELEAVVQANKGNPVGRKQKGIALKTKPASLDMIDPSKLALMDGTFRVQGSPISQLAVQQLGPVACGVALITLEEAMPYLRAGKRVSSEPLAIAVFAPVNAEVTTSLPHSKVMIPCMCVANREPLLVEATLVQLGQGVVEKHVANTAVELDNLEVVTLKVMVYHDEFSGQWEEFVAAPIKHLVCKLPILRRCTGEQCQCDSWHNSEGLAVKDPIMDVWRRQFLSAAFKPVKALKADIFSVCLRVPAVLLSILLPLSGISGIYLEPRTPEGREIMPEYAVIWTPRMSASEMAHIKQTNPVIIGFARIGDRKGFRVLAGQAKSMHELVRPESTFLPSGPKNHHVAGPFPWGSDRQAIAKAMRQVGWQVKALQPLQPIPGRGSMWLLQAVDEPPAAIIQTSNGEVVISKHREQTAAKTPAPSTVGSVSTLSLCGSSSGQPAGDVDPWLQADPWGPYTMKKGHAAQSSASDGLHQLEERLQTAILAKIPTAMEQDDLPDRMSSLESQVQLLMSKHQTLEGQVTEVSVNTSQQFAVVQQQIQQQGQSFHGQLETHAQGIQAMFTQQMEQIRGLLAKRPRDESLE